jgi:low temperature requirement protein LtrA
MYLRVMRLHPESAALSRGYAVGFSIGAAVWLGSLLLPADLHWVGWLVGISIELAVPLIPQMLKVQWAHPFDPHHINERMGIFILIVLGEAFVKVLDDAQGIQLGGVTLLFSTFGLLVMYSLWWLYFADTIEAGMDTSNVRKVILWLYGHLPLVAGLVSFGVASKKLFAAAAEYPGEPLDPEYRLLYTAALVLYLGALALIEYGTQGMKPHRVGLRAASAGLVLLIGLVATTVDATAFVILMAIVMLAQVAYNLLTTRAVHAG